MTMETTGPAPDVTAGTTDGEPTVMLPATYRFDCLDVIEMGDGDGDGQPDGSAIQAVLLENTWMADIEEFRLSVLLTVLSRDEPTGTAELTIGSAIGPSASNLCVEPTSASGTRLGSFDAMDAAWQPVDAQGACSAPALGDEFAGTYSLALQPADTIYIYAQEQDGTVLNCVPGGGAPNAVPLHAIQATVTVDDSEDETIAAGQLTGCLLDSEAQNLCSCLGECVGAPFAPCAGCPDGSVPLSDLLGAVGPTDNCTDIMGETAYDLTIGFSAQRLEMDDPPLCE